MASYQVQLKKKEELAEGTMAFHFKKPSNFQFKAGQFLNVTLLDPPETDAEGITRSFSIADAPFEENLMVATRMRDTAFKRVLKKLPLGGKVKIDGPFGSFTLRGDSSRPAVFLAGGIGITPFRSILLQATHKGLAHHLTLFYSNRQPKDAAFLKELSELEYTNYKFIGTMTKTEKPQWRGETGYINREMLSRYIEDLMDPIYYIAGPPGMVASMAKMLSEAGVEEDNIKSEEFEGY